MPVDMFALPLPSKSIEHEILVSFVFLSTISFAFLPNISEFELILGKSLDKNN